MGRTRAGLPPPRPSRAPGCSPDAHAPGKAGRRLSPAGGGSHRHVRGGRQVELARRPRLGVEAGATRSDRCCRRRTPAGGPDPARAGQRRGPIAAVDRLVRMLSLQWSCLAGPETQQARGDAHTNQALARRARCPHADPPPSIPATLACPCRRCRAQAPRHSHKSHTCTHSVCISMRARARCMHNAASRRAAPHAPLLAVPPLAAAAAALAHRRGRRRLNQQPGKGAMPRTSPPAAPSPGLCSGAR